ncbi:MAG: phosphomannomutase/phosphoglucomutase, partial [Myxococcales bacterium]|nr:phosphomannomutase/phosphoglucomutase [Myxococcales bacterium]
YDIRGVAERDLTSELVERVAHAFAVTIATEVGRRPSFALGRDGRLSSPRLHDAVVKGFVAAGARVRDVGVGPTPLVYFAAHHLETDAALQITGSHNPGEDNGLKLMRGKASFFGADIQSLRARVASGLPLPVASGGSHETIDISDAYVDGIRRASRLPDGELPRVVVDAGNGAAGPLGVRTLRALGLEVDPLFEEIDGRFPNHHPDPTQPENLVALKRRVLETGAPLGLAWDGDGDRLGAIDEHGEIVWGDKLMILFSRALLEERPGASILGEVKCSETLFDDIRKHGGIALYSKTGHSLIKTRMKKEGALLAGEMSGHLFFADRFFGYDDAIYAAVRLIEIVAREKAPLSRLLADVPPTFATPELRVDCPDERKFDVVARVLEHFKKTHDVLDIDGARIGFGDGAWGLCRASNTQPVLVLRFEASSEARLATIRAEVEAVVAQASRA